MVTIRPSYNSTALLKEQRKYQSSARAHSERGHLIVGCACRLWVRNGPERRTLLIPKVPEKSNHKHSHRKRGKNQREREMLELCVCACEREKDGIIIYPRHQETFVCVCAVVLNSSSASAAAQRVSEVSCVIVLAPEGLEAHPLLCSLQGPNASHIINNECGRTCLLIIPWNAENH
jgi:hypothetical protein